MKKTHQNLIIALVLLLAIAFIFIWTKVATEKNQGIVMPDIYKVYSVDDYKNTDMESEEVERLVVRLNKDFEYLREQNYEDESQIFDIWVDIGNTKKALQDFEGAVEAWKYASSLNDINPIPYSNLADYYKSFAHDYDQAIYYYDQAIMRDNTGYFFDYQAYAEIYIDYLPEDPNKVEIIMLDGVEKAVGPTRLNFYAFLYNYFNEKNNQTKVDFYKNKVLEVDPNYQF